MPVSATGAALKAVLCQPQHIHVWLPRYKFVVHEHLSRQDIMVYNCTAVKLPNKDEVQLDVETLRELHNAHASLPFPDKIPKSHRMSGKQAKSGKGSGVGEENDVDEEEEEVEEASDEEPDSRPLRGTMADEGRIVLVPVELWPGNECDENEGRGWLARITRCRDKRATVRFLHSTDEEGKPYEQHLATSSLVVPV